MKAVKEGDLALIEEIVSKRGNINVRERVCFDFGGESLHKGRTPLYYAVDREDLDTAELLISLGAELTAVSLEDPDSDVDLFELAASQETDTVLNFLLDKMAPGKPAQQDLYFAVRNGNIKKSADLLACDSISVNQGNWLGDHPLVIAAYGGHTRIVEMLLQQGADIDARNCYGVTAFDLAILNGFNDIFHLLLSYGYDPYSNRSTDGLYGWTPLYGAVAVNNFDITEFLLRNGADPNAQASPLIKDFPISRAVYGADLNVVKVLVEHGASLEVTGLLGESLLDVAHNSLGRDTLPRRPAGTTRQIIDYLKRAMGSPVELSERSQ